MASRSSFISLSISSSLAPFSSACLSASWAWRRRFSAAERSPSSMPARSPTDSRRRRAAGRRCGHLKPRRGAHDGQVVRHRRDGTCPRAGGDGAHQVEHAGLAVGVERQDAPLLDHRPGQRIGEGPSRQRDGLALGRPLPGRPRPSPSASAALWRSSPDMLGQVARCLGGRSLRRIAAGQRKRHLRCALERTRVGRLRLLQRELGLSRVAP